MPLIYALAVSYIEYMGNTNHIKNFLEGFGSAIDIAPRRGYVSPGGFSIDAKNLARDASYVARCVNEKTMAYGK